ncbi:MAG: hypothetical protein DRI90_09070 [Deltaproteobacteria bacterium]|nr:MAG: hypothetical protein DRI90_09070 [Deltaproteobacteria bacterium]
MAAAALAALVVPAGLGDVGQLVSRASTAKLNRRDGAVLALCRYRLSTRFGARLSWLVGIGAALLVFGVTVVGGEAMANRELLIGSMRWIAWLAATPVALAAAAAPAERDRREGVDVLAAIHGVSAVRLELARGLAAMVAIGLRIGLPSLLLCLLMATVGPAWRHLLLVPGVALFAAWGGVLIGGIAAASGHFGGARGRSLLAAVVLLPWLLSELWVTPGLSIPGGMDMMLTFLVDMSTPGVRGL